MSGEQEVRARLRRLPRPPLPADVRAELEQRLAAEATVVPLTPQHRRRLNWLLAAAVSAGLVMIVGLSSERAPAPGDTSPPVVRAGAVFQPTGVVDELKARWRDAGTLAPTRTFADSPQGIADCARAIGAYGRILAVDVGTYDDTEAVVLVAVYIPDTHYEEVWVVHPGCGQGRAPVMRHMLADLDGSASDAGGA